MGTDPPCGLYRVGCHSGHTLLLKAVPRDRASEAAQARLKQEFEVHRQLEVEGLVRVIDRVEDDSHLALVYEDPGGQPLARLLEAGPTPLETALEIARQVAVTLAALHHRGYSHRDLRPCHILVGNPADSGTDVSKSIHPSKAVVTHSLSSQDYRRAEPRAVRIGLLGLGSSAQLPQEWPGVYRPDSGNDPSYLSPEQTGRINRKVDYRTDFYSLGVILFQMLTGRPPFVADDPVALVHAHLAKPPPAPSQVAPGIPLPVSALVLKLLAKAAEDRYQSGYGIAADLERCLRGWQAQGTIETFTLGEQDVPVRLELPQRLYGRRAELEKLIQHVTAAARGTPQVLWVAGYPGVGKTALIQELRGPIFLHHGFFASGKYDELEHGAPYRAIRQALSSLGRRLLGEPQEKLERYRAQWREALGINLGVMVDLVPDLNVILGETLPPAKLEPMAAKHRFHWCVYQFLDRLASEDHPLVLFLDDLQWSDSADLELLQDLLGRGLKHFLFLGAYRDHQINDHHPLLETLAALRAQGIPVDVLNLRPLDADDIGHWIADAFRADPTTAAALAERVYQKTAGNPFFIRLFLLSLYETKILKFSPPTGWQWDLSTVSAQEATENVI
ncbi:MAG TPA: AAA family ATPase, partial [Candidatus Competibacteraceae bacterium]|nr:AAA family ATPase [Candidatus Competibacteraceae bacterium]